MHFILKRFQILNLVRTAAIVLLLSLACSPASSAATARAVFAGGCFWCMEGPFERLPGVSAVISGYSGGPERNPGYEQVSSGTTGHRESVEVHYDPARITYQQLLDVFWRQIDPTDSGGQFVDRGPQYRAAIFYGNENEHQAALRSRDALAASHRFQKPIVTEILPLGRFYAAEEYHQDFYKKNPEHYHRYRSGSGRDSFLQQHWGASAPHAENEETVPARWREFQKPALAQLRQRLSPMAFRVTQQEGTEPPFQNEYWNNHEPGIYVDVVSGEPLFASRDKFESGTGWPSFTRALVPEQVVERQDASLGMVRTEVRSRLANSHLGHVFEDGPAPTGRRFCINSAALRFIPAAQLQSAGYGAYAAAALAPAQ